MSRIKKGGEGGGGLDRGRGEGRKKKEAKVSKNRVSTNQVITDAQWIKSSFSFTPLYYHHHHYLHLHSKQDVSAAL